MAASTEGSRAIASESAAVSVGLIGEQMWLDLTYEEDAAAEVDLNVIMTDGGDFVEVQGTAEGRPFSQDCLTEMVDLSRPGIASLLQEQREALGAD